VARDGDENVRGRAVQLEPEGGQPAHQGGGRHASLRLAAQLHWVIHDSRRGSRQGDVVSD
jgi:hypothetical protein